jgi:hypothetical protein
MGSYQRFVRNLHLSPEETEQVLWKNTARLFRIDTAAIPKNTADPAAVTAEPPV